MCTARSDSIVLPWVGILLLTIAVAHAVGEDTEPAQPSLLKRLADALRGEGAKATIDDEPYAPTGKLIHVDLSTKVNKKLTDGTKVVDGNTLEALPQGVLTLAGVDFRIIDGIMQLTSQGREEYPKSIEAIPVHDSFARLYFFHATQGGSTEIPVGAQIGRYVIHYENGFEATVPIVFGEDVRDWWNVDQSTKPKRGKVAWVGTNPGVRSFGYTLRLFVSKWGNPHPETRVTTVDYVSENLGEAGPFCLAMTLEKSEPAE
jgi:hypothetical protein